MEAAETRPETFSEPSGTPTDPSDQTESAPPAKEAKKPSGHPQRRQRRQRRSDLVDGECACCVNGLPDEPGAPLDLDRIMNVSGDLPVKYYVCSKQCRNDLRPAKWGTSTIQDIRARISNTLTPHLKTPIRPGDQVVVIHDYSAGRKVQEGLGTVLKLFYESATGAVTLAVKTLNGTVRVGLAGVKPVDKENVGPGASSMATSRQPLRPTRNSDSAVSLLTHQRLSPSLASASSSKTK